MNGRNHELLTLLAYTTLAAGCLDEGNDTPRTSAPGTSATTSPATTTMTSGDTGDFDPFGTSGESTTDTDPKGPPPATSSEPTTDADSTAGSTSGGGSDSSEGEDAAEVCTRFGELVFECHQGEYGYTAQQYIGYCMQELLWYEAGESQTCFEALLADYACAAALDCKGLMLEPGPCQETEDAFEEACS